MEVVELILISALMKLMWFAFSSATTSVEDPRAVVSLYGLNDSSRGFLSFFKTLSSTAIAVPNRDAITPSRKAKVNTKDNQKNI